MKGYLKNQRTMIQRHEVTWPNPIYHRRSTFDGRSVASLEIMKGSTAGVVVALGVLVQRCTSTIARR